MFITHDSFRSPISGMFGDQENSLWFAAELSIHAPWFLVKLLHVEIYKDQKSIEFCRTILLTRVNDVVQLASSEGPKGLKLHSASIVIPGHMNKSGEWRMEELSAVWTAGEPSHPNQAVEIYESANGKFHVYSMLGTKFKDLRNKQLVCKFKAAM